MKIIGRILPQFFTNKRLAPDRRLRYKKLWVYGVFLTMAVSLIPLIIMTVINIHQTQDIVESEIKQPIATLVMNAKRSFEYNFEERKAALNFIINDRSFEDLSNEQTLSQVFFNLKRAFGGFVDLGLIDSDGLQKAYVGPYDLMNIDYSDQEWYDEIKLRDSYISDVFMGFRGFPHFIIAVKHEKAGEGFYIIRATLDIEFINRQIQTLDIGSLADAFLINREGSLQTKSYYYGDILSKFYHEVPRYSPRAEVIETVNGGGEPFIIGYAYIEQSPFVFMIVENAAQLFQSWITLRRDIIGILIISAFLIVVVIFWGTTYMVNRISDADTQHDKMVHSMEYTNKMASIGRLAAGVAHEINNPLAIINQKAGLFKDIVDAQEEYPQKEKFLKLIDSILQSVDRCSLITHRFLGFAKRMDVQVTPINIESLLREVLDFLGKEAVHRNILVHFEIAEDVPEIESDKGQLQQVFLNIVNNSFAAIDDGGRIELSAKRKGTDRIEVAISDDGIGISEENLNQIFEPFFTSKKQGTGLGLSITYGIVKKLGGDIKVKSKVGKGTSFKVILPAKVIN
ncbi:ATP-binding protein [candidate division KSB1 bacterium]